MEIYRITVVRRHSVKRSNHDQEIFENAKLKLHFEFEQKCSIKPLSL